MKTSMPSTVWFWKLQFYKHHLHYNNCGIFFMQPLVWARITFLSYCSNVPTALTLRENVAMISSYLHPILIFMVSLEHAFFALPICPFFFSALFPFSLLPFHFIRIWLPLFFNLLGKETCTYSFRAYLLTFLLEMIPLSFISLLPVLKWWLVGFAFSGMSWYFHIFLNFLLLFKPQVLQTSHSFSLLLWHLCRNPFWALHPSASSRLVAFCLLYITLLIASSRCSTGLEPLFCRCHIQWCAATHLTIVSHNK